MNDSTNQPSYVPSDFGAIEVPINERGRSYLANEGTEYLDEDYKTMYYPFEIDRTLEPLFMKFNDTFGLLIDDCEEELLPADKVGEALELAKAFIRSASEKHRPVIAEFIALLEFARDTNMPVAFNF